MGELKMSFYEWCIKNYYGQESSKGKFAEYMKTDVAFPVKSISKIEIEVYLMSKKLGCEVIKIFRAIYEKEYIRDEVS